MLLPWTYIQNYLVTMGESSQLANYDLPDTKYRKKRSTNKTATYLIQWTLCISALNMAVHFLDWYFHILIAEGEPVWAEAKTSVFPSNARAETWNDCTASYSCFYAVLNVLNYCKVLKVTALITFGFGSLLAASKSLYLDSYCFETFTVK